MKIGTSIVNFARKAFQGMLAPIYSGGAHGNGGWWPLGIREPFSGAWQRNMERTAEDLLCNPIVYACETLISNDIGKIRYKLVTKVGEIWKENTSNSPFWPVLRKPNRYQNHVQFKQWWITSKLRFGNTYALKEQDARGIVTALYILDPCRVTPLVADDGSIYYRLGKDNLSGLQDTDIIVPADKIIHDRMNCLYHPLVGIPPMYAAAIVAGIGLTIQENASSFFANNSTPGGILVVPGNIKPENAKAIVETWKTKYGGTNTGSIALLEAGMDFKPMGRVNATDSQLLETLKWSDERVCSVFHVPAYKVGVGQAPAYNNIEALDQKYYSDCLQSLIEEMEACLDEGLGLDGVTMGVSLDDSNLIRMDRKAQMELLSEGVKATLLTPNEGRAALALDPVTGGDSLWMQQQNYSLEALADRDKNGFVPSSGSGASSAAPAPSPTPAPPPDANSGDNASEDAAAKQIYEALIKRFEEELV